MALTAIEKLVRALRVRLQVMTPAGAVNWDMGSIYGEIKGEIDCPIASIMGHINACVLVCAEFTEIGNLSCTDFIDVTDPVALDEAIEGSAHGNGSSCGLGRNPRVVLGELILMPAAPS
jgi:hypothetical protein